MINERVVLRLYSWPVANYDVIILEHSLFPSHKHLHTNALGQLSPSERTRGDASTTKTKMSSTFRIVFLHATLTTVETRGGRQRKSVEIPDMATENHFLRPVKIQAREGTRPPNAGWFAYKSRWQVWSYSCLRRYCCRWRPSHKNRFADCRTAPIGRQWRRWQMYLLGVSDKRRT